MRYQAPYNTQDNTGYVNGNPAAGIAGSIPPAAAFEQPMRELVALISNSNITPSDGDLQQVSRAVRSQWMNYCEATNVGAGTQNAITVSVTPTPGALTKGLPLRVLIAQNNTSSVTMNVSETGTFPCIRANGAALEANDLVAGQLADFVFDGTNFQLANFIGVGDNIVNNNYTTDIPYVVDTSIVANTITATYNPALVAHVNGKLILVKLANTVTAQTTININALAGKIVKRYDGFDFDIGDVIAGEILALFYDGAYYQCLNTLPPRQRLFLPFYPEISYPTNAKLSITGGGGTVSVDTSQKFIWRASVEIRTADFSAGARQLSTLASQTYHLRWHAPGTGDAAAIGTYPYGRFVIKNLTDGAYNPGGANENDVAFDSHYDDMLIAKVVTNGSNVSTVTSLENRMRLEKEASRTSWRSFPSGQVQPDAVSLNWARKPREIHFRSISCEAAGTGDSGLETLEAWGMMTYNDMNDGTWTASRYSTWVLAYGEMDPAPGSGESEDWNQWCYNALIEA